MRTFSVLAGVAEPWRLGLIACRRTVTFNVLAWSRVNNSHSPQWHLAMARSLSSHAHIQGVLYALTPWNQPPKAVGHPAAPTPTRGRKGGRCDLSCDGFLGPSPLVHPELLAAVGGAPACTIGLPRCIYSHPLLCRRTNREHRRGCCSMVHRIKWQGGGHHSCVARRVDRGRNEGLLDGGAAVCRGGRLAR